MAGTDFPVSEHYKDSILDARTISRSGSWWSAILLLEEPSKGNRFLCFYRWQSVDGTWKTRSKFKLNSLRDVEKVHDIVNLLKGGL